MYYYIFQPNSTGKEIILARVKNSISLHGITGESGTPSPSRSLEDLVTQAAEKGYNTVVAVGDGGFLTEVAKLVAKSDIALGGIPIGASAELHELLGVKTIDQAILSLKQRHVRETGLGVISPGRIFLLSATISLRNPHPVVVESKSFKVEGTFTNLVIDRKDMATVKFFDQSSKYSVIRRFARWLIGKPTDDPTETVLRSPTLSISTGEPLDILIEGKTIAKTPCKVRVSPRALKLIQARGTLEQ